MRFEAHLAIGMKAADAEPLDRWVSFHLQNKRLQMLGVAALVGADTLRMGCELQVTDWDRQEVSHALGSLLPRPLVVM